MTIKKKLALIIASLFVLSLVLIGILFISNNIMKSSIKNINEANTKIVNNLKIEAIHEKFMGTMCRSVVKAEEYSSKGDHTSCVLGKWLYPFLKTKEYELLPQDIKEKLRKLELSHKKLHQISKEFSNKKIADKDLKDQIVNMAPLLFKDVISGLNAYSDILLKEKENLSDKVDSFISTISYIIVFIFIISLFIGAFGLKSSHKIIKNLEAFKHGLENFFDFIGRKTNNIEVIAINSNDEIGVMSKQVNQSIDNIKIELQKDHIVIDEIIDIVNKAKDGFYTYNINSSTSNPQLEELKNTLNKMFDLTQKNLAIVTSALIEYGNAKYDHKINSNISGNVASLVKGTNALGASISEVLSMVNSSSNRVSSNAEELAATAEQLSASATQQAASLEETAAAIEEITSAISSTSERTSNMSLIAKELKSTSKEDDELAHKTGKAMDEINKATNDIVEAIAIIDQIAFQTNILSLNAAVEAATAGEAGKGFAVVAGEVRNLASRSAEAARKIKSLVDFAQNKTEEGKETAEKMVESFNFLNEKISQVTSDINEVSTASQEQLEGMNQINDAVNQLDKATQENANASEVVSNKAMNLSELSAQLIELISRTSFDKEKMNQVCDVNLVFDTTKLKLDHIAFKETNFKDLGNQKEWRVKSHLECALGKWLKEHENESFAQHEDWQKLLDAHKKVHDGVQKYIYVDAKDKTDPSLHNIAKDIEENTSQVFYYIDQMKIHKCEGFPK